jgi:hypothetical protein
LIVDQIGSLGQARRETLNDESAQKRRQREERVQRRRR